jgi:hypothetical protein
MENPIEFVSLREVADDVSGKMYGSWRRLDQVHAETMAFDFDIDRVITMIAKRCKAGEIIDPPLDRRLARASHNCHYSATAVVRPTGTFRGHRIAFLE